MGSSLFRRSLFGLGLLAGVVAVGRRRLDRATARRVSALTSAAATESHPDQTFHPDDVAHLPDPVRRYFETVLEAGRPSVASVRLEQRGEFRLGGRSGSWKPMTATQHYGVDPPGFVWDATIDVAPLVPVRVVDAYERGRGSLRASLCSTVPVADAEPGPEMNEAELQRYLAEAVWFPTALLPDAGVEWAAVDERSARATLRDRGNAASLVFHFDDEGLVERVTTAERYRQEDDDYAPWTGHFGDYQWIDGRLIPTEASVEWVLPAGDLPYWRAEITAVEHRR
ncbi:DUF6920 family protein [Halomicrobium salinisoli]|uniref:DUF6920 family protein n=1 Tax=Halomicrobium salinisoli TaxID=2878391 RepID=UPI001CF0D4A1|nr:DUF6544 family protein [Halomicrobium salinisoli]